MLLFMHLCIKAVSALSCATHTRREPDNPVRTAISCDVADLPSDLPLLSLAKGFEQEQFTTATSPRAYSEMSI